MGIDAPTMLLLTLGIAGVAATFLALEWRAVRDPALVFWSAGFATIVVGCSVSPLRQGVSILVGVWIANGLLIVAHLLFLYGVARFLNRQLTLVWWATLGVWALLLLPSGLNPTTSFGVANAGLVAILALRTAALLWRDRADVVAGRLGAVFLAHGVFYGLKAGLVLAPGAVIDPIAYKGLLIQVSLLWGIMVEVVLCLLMAAAVRRRWEEQVAALAERDPLTGTLNRRGFQRHAAACLRGLAAGRHQVVLFFIM